MYRGALHLPIFGSLHAFAEQTRPFGHSREDGKGTVIFCTPVMVLSFRN